MKTEHFQHMNQEDKILSGLFKYFEPVKGSHEIKRKTMDRVLKDWSEHPVVITPVINKYNRLWIALGIAFMILTAYLFDTKSFAGFNSLLNFLSFTSLQETFASTYSLIGKIPTIIVLLLIGMSALLGLDRFLNRLANI